MTGSWVVRVTDVRPFTIHGDVYYEVHADRLDDDSNSAMILRVPEHASKSVPAVGQTVTAQFLMGQVTALTVRD